MSKPKKYKFVPKKKKTLTDEPNWAKLCKSKTEEDKYNAFVECEKFVHDEITDKEYLHSMKKWIRVESGWGVNEQLNKIPDVYLISFSKHGWKAIKLGFMPKSVESTLKKSLMPLLDKADELRDKMVVDPVIHPSHFELDDDDEWHPSKVKEWIKKWSAYGKSLDPESKDPKIRMEYQTTQTYVKNMNTYLRSSVWLDSHWGENREHRVLQVCRTMAYDDDGMAKRDVGTYYPDMGAIWTKEMQKDANTYSK